MTQRHLRVEEEFKEGGGGPWGEVSRLNAAGAEEALMLFCAC